jgi:molybdopterin-synthase adenylyltransferase
MRARLPARKATVPDTWASTVSLSHTLLGLMGRKTFAYALWFPSQSSNRLTALISHPILPAENDRYVHGNASTTAEYLGRAIQAATERRAGIVFLHSHPAPGWQDMSEDDISTERRQAITAKPTTDMPLVGLTLGRDGAWSARLWIKTVPKTYERRWV